MMRALVLMLCGIALTGCPQKTKTVVSHRENCLVCHEPRDDNGVPSGIEDAHPWEPLSCVRCHGGDPWVCDGTKTEHAGENPSCSGEWVYDLSAHVSPGDGPKFLKNLSSQELDGVDPAYVRFINPGDFRVAAESCGTEDCHPGAMDVVRSTMTHTSGELTVARYRAGAQAEPRARFGSVHVEDPAPDPNDRCGVAEIERFDPDPAGTSAGALTVATAQDDYMAKSCMRCHLNDFGENKFQGDFRSSGCTACHMKYEDDGRSRSGDPRIDKLTVPHPAKHEMVTAAPVDQCTHCHYRGGRIGISYQGYRESAGAGLNPPNPEVLGKALHGHDANYYLTDENFENDFDETPADVHFEAGMDCVDCHRQPDTHGNGHLYADTQCSVATECEDCHGTVREYADPPATYGEYLYREDGVLKLRTRVSDLILDVPQVKDTVTVGQPGYTAAAEQSMGVHDGVSHTDKVECYTCHAAWIPTCYGCHVELDLTRDSRYQTTGELTRGHPTGRREWVTLNDLVLMRNTDGKYAPSMPAERFFMSVVDRDDAASDAAGTLVKRDLIRSEPRTFTAADGRKMAGFGQRAFNPHTTRSRTTFMACDRCHSVGDATAPTNEVLLDLTYGFGTSRFPVQGCDVSNDDLSCDELSDWMTYQLDAIQTRQGEPLVVVGHPDPEESRPLTLDEIQVMRDIVVNATTEIPPDAATDPTWPHAKRVE